LRLKGESFLTTYGPGQGRRPKLLRQVLDCVSPLAHSRRRWRRIHESHFLTPPSKRGDTAHSKRFATAHAPDHIAPAFGVRCIPPLWFEVYEAVGSFTRPRKRMQPVRLSRMRKMKG